MTKQNDRVSYSFGMKLSLPAKYESADFHISLSRDVEESEGLDKTLDRVKKQVHQKVAEIYEAIRASETGLLNEGTKQERVPSQNVEKPLEKPTNKPIDPRVFKQQIKLAFGVLEAQRKITKDVFKANYLSNKKVDDLNENETLFALIKLRETFPELKL